ncbi:hypothetical protein [uncultured Fusobacterium sp.]|uniref:toxin-antitoxin system YwqK family antitoxin n=1 Tax=uncultured Fusobacterium sp. TaxID=159267 RepID=UPI0025CFE391|nr:hypothetical protein [uncultured Fusobacterium sp.]
MKRIFKLILLFVVISTISFGKTAYKPMYVQSSEGTLICDRETKEPLNGKYEIIDNDIWGREYVAMEAEIKNGLLHGKCIEYVSAGKMLRQANYKNGKLHGKFEGITYLNGTKLPNYEFVVIGNYKNGGFDGKIIYYRTVFTEEDKDSAAFKLIEKGYKGIMRTKCEEVYYEDGIRNGSYKMWFTNGKIARDYIFENGKSVRMKNYYLNGSLQTDGRTEKNGDVYEKEYYENGKLKAEFKGNLNTLNMTRKEYDETGKVIKEEKVENGVRVL